MPESDAARDGARPSRWWSRPGAVFAFAFVALALSAAGRGLNKVDEHRYATVARELTLPGAAEHGAPWVLTLNGDVYTHKPPLYFWMTAAGGSFGLDWSVAAQLPSFLGAALAVASVFAIARRLHGPVAGWAAAIALAASKEFLILSARGNLDALLSGFTTLSAAAFVFACDGSTAPSRRTAWSALAWTAGGFALLVKGPPVLATPGAAILATVLWTRGFRGFATPRLALAPLALVPALVWFAGAASAGHGGYPLELLRHGASHAEGKVDKIEPWWFYAPSFLLGAMPWTPALAAALATLRPRSGDARVRDADRFALCWLLAPLAVFCMSPAKRDLYLVPVYPAVALLVGRLVATAFATPRSAWPGPLRVGMGATAWVAVAGGAACAAFGASRLAGTDGFLGAEVGGWGAARGRVPEACAWASAALGAASIACGAAALRGGARAAVASLAGFACVILAFRGAVFTPVDAALRDERAFIEAAGRAAGDRPIVDGGGADFAVNWMLGRRRIDAFENPTAAVRAARNRGMLPAYFLVERERLDRTGLPPGAKLVMQDGRDDPESLRLIRVDRRGE